MPMLDCGARTEASLLTLDLGTDGSTCPPKHCSPLMPASPDSEVAEACSWRPPSPRSPFDPALAPPEYCTLFNCRGFVFNTRQTSNSLQVPRPASSSSPCLARSATLLDPASPRHLAAILETTPPTTKHRAPPPHPTTAPNIALLRAVEQDVAERLASPRGRFLRTATRLHSRLCALDGEAACLIHSTVLLRIGFQELLADSESLVRQARRLCCDLQDVLYLDDLLWMLRGRLDHVTPRPWPFLDARLQGSGPVNLVV